VLATHSICQFPLHFPSRASPCTITFQLDSTIESSKNLLAINHQHFPILIHYFVGSYRTLTNLICALYLRDIISDFLLLSHYNYSDFFDIKHCLYWLKYFVFIFLALFLSRKVHENVKKVKQSRYMLGVAQRVPGS